MSLDHVIVVDEHASVRGGATRVAIDEARGLSAAGLSVTYFAAIGPVCAELTSERIRVVLLNQRRLLDAWTHPEVLYQSLWNAPAYHAMHELLDHMDPQSTIVHVHGFSQTISASPIRCAMDRGFPVISTLHDYFTVCPNGGFFDYKTGTVCERRPLSLSCVMTNCDKRNYPNKLYRLLRTHAQHHVCRMPSGVKHYITPSDAAARRVRNYLPNDAILFPLRNPCNVGRSEPARIRSQTYVAMVGRLSPEKGIETVVEAAKKTGTRILFIGDGPLRRTAEACGAHIVTGWVTHSEILKLLDGVRCLVFPSLVPETYGLSVVDAAARGIPSIVTDVCGVAEWITDGVTGWRIPPGDVQALAARLEAVKDDNLVEAAGTAVYTEYWRSPLSLGRHIKDLLEIYKQASMFPCDASSHAAS